MNLTLRYLTCFNLGWGGVIPTQRRATLLDLHLHFYTEHDATLLDLHLYVHTELDATLLGLRLYFYMNLTLGYLTCFTLGWGGVR